MTRASTSGRPRFFTRAGVVIWIGATLGTVAVLPYVLALAPAHATPRGGLSVPLLIASVAQSALFLAVMTFSGLWAASKLDLGAPVLDAWCRGESAPAGAGRRALLAAVSGVAVSAALLALDLGVFMALSPHGVGQLLRQRQPPTWAGFLASFEGGITEEVELRLFLLSWLLLGLRFARRRITRRRAAPHGPLLFWTANVLAAVAFGLGHLPITARLVALTPVVVARALVLNGAVGLVTGAWFWTSGIETAMVCHFAADLVLHVAAPLAQAWLLSL